MFLGHKGKSEILCAEQINNTFSTDDLLLASNINSTTESNIFIENETTDDVSVSEEFWPYIINSILHVLFGLLLVTAACFRVGTENRNSGSTRPEKTLTEIWLFVNDFKLKIV